MSRLLLRRLLQSIPLLLIVSSLTFLLVSFIPGSVATALLGVSGTRAQYLAVEHQLGLDRPVYEQYGTWLVKAVTGDLGQSLQNKQDVTSLIAGRVGVTVSLIVITTAVVAVVGVALGVAAAIRPGRVAVAIDALTWIGLAIPNFWLGLLLITVFAVVLRLLPAEGYVPMQVSPTGWLASLLLPVVALAAGPLAVVVKQTRDAMRDELGRDSIRLLRAAGVSERSLVLRHALRNAAIPVVTVIGVLVIQLLGGTVVVETVFALPGLGSLAVSSVSAHDLPVIEGVTVTFTIIVVVVNLLVDAGYGWLNPRVRVS